MTAAAAELDVPENSSTAGPTYRRSTFAALRVPNFRIYAAGQCVANTGVWMQNIALDWLVLELTRSATAVGVTMALQFLPMLLFGMYGGMIADRFPKRTILMVTVSLNATVSAVLAALAISGTVHVAYVYLLALAGGLVFVVDNPTRQVFVNEVVPAPYVRNAIALNAAVFHTTRLLGPVIASLLIATIGTGWAFAANAICYLGPLVGLARMHTADLTPFPPAPRSPRPLRSALGYVAARRHVAWTIVLVGVFGTFGLNFPVVLTAMAQTTFGGDAGLYGLFNVVLAVGSVTGALLAGRRPQTRQRLIIAAAVTFGLAQSAAALAPDLGFFLAALLAMGVSNLAFQTMANASVQSWVDPAVRGRVMGLYMLAFVGGSPIGGPLVGWITAQAGPRVGMLVCGLVPMMAAVAVAVVFTRGSTYSKRAYNMCA